MTTPASITVPSWFGPIRIETDPEFAPRRTTRAVRGLRRYFRTLRRDAARFAADPNGWYDHHHWHVDRRGHGNLDWDARREHLAALFTMFRRLLAELADWPTPHQAWLRIHPHDSSQDALYLHTPNENADNFPHDFDYVTWDVEVPARLRALMSDPSWQFGRCDTRSTQFIVRLRPPG